MLRAALCLVLVLIAAARANAQMRFDPNTERGRNGVALFNEVIARKGKPTLKCRVSRFGPELGFDLKVVSGFYVSIPLAEVVGRDRLLMFNIVRVTPVKPAGEPVWFFRQLGPPRIPDEMRNNLKGRDMSTSGRFLLGSGEFKVDWVMVDSEDRACVESWKLKSNPPEQERIGIVPGFVAQDNGPGAWRGPAMVADNGTHATIFVNAYPVYPRRHMAQLSGWDRRMLGSALTSTIDGGGFSSARVVVFDLERRTILFETDNFNGASYRTMLRALGEADIATIDYSILKSTQSEYDFLESLLSAETGKADKSDAFVFITPSWKPIQRKRKLAPEVALRLPATYGVVLASRPGWMEGAVIDLVKQVDGRVRVIYRASDLARAASEIKEDLSGAGQ